MTTDWIISVWSNFLVVDSEGKNADLVNPNGEIVGEIVSLLATHASGRRYNGPVVGRISAECPLGSFEKYAWAFAGQVSDEWSPSSDPLWRKTFPVYGSREHLLSSGKKDKYKSTDSIYSAPVDTFGICNRPIILQDDIDGEITPRG